MGYLDDYTAVALTSAPILQKEVVLDRKTGQTRQAGATTPEGRWITQTRRTMEGSLYAFAKGVLGREYLTPQLHLPICNFIQHRPPQRKGVLLPREHGKTTIVSHALSLHILIQPKDNNLYFPGEDGEDQRVLLIGETQLRAKDALRVMAATTENNTTFRALWPHRVWDSPRRQAKKWNDEELIFPRKNEWPDPSIRAIGVGGATTGAHPSVLIKDDLVTLEAANSPVVMQTAIDYHVTSRALINEDTALEFIVGTRWAVMDLYHFIMTTDATVEWVTKAIVEDGRPLWPERFDLVKIERLQKEFGVLFPLLYMNNATSPELTDFDMEMIRTYTLVDGYLEFQEDERDIALSQQLNAPAPVPDVPVGTRLNRETWQQIYTPGHGGIRLRGG